MTARSQHQMTYGGKRGAAGPRREPPSRRRPHRVLLACAFVALTVTGCRGESERSAMARAPERDPAGPNASPSDTAAVRLRRLWTSPYRTFAFSSISPDGRYLSMVDWSTIDLAVRDLKTGELHRLTNVVREPGKPYEDAGVSLFSPDGSRILYGWQLVPDVQLRVVDFGLDGRGVPRAAEPSVVFHNPEYEPYFPFDWSPDGSTVVAKVWMGGQDTHTHSVNHLALISTVDGTYRGLKSFDWREPLRAAFSPDGAWVAYDFPPEDGAANRDIYVVSIDGSYERAVVDDPAVDRLMDWHPDGSILFHSDRDGSPGVWRLPMADGRAVGPAELLRADMWGVQPLGSGPGRFYYGLDVNPPQLYTAAVDLDGGRLASPPVAFVDPSRVQVRGWAWSPDGEFLAYSAPRPGAAQIATAAFSASVIGIVSSTGTHEQTVDVELEATGLIRWDPDGTAIIASTVDSKARRGFYRIELESGSVSRILSVDDLADGHFDITPDGRTLYYGVMNTESTDEWLTLRSHNLDSGVETDLGPIGWPGRVAVSPDGSRIAAVLRDPVGGAAAVGTIPAAGGSPTLLHRWPQGSYAFDLTWTPDGESLLYFSAQPGSDALERTVPWTVDVEEGTARQIQLTDHVDPRLVSLHPDGRRIAFMAGEARGEVWVMEGLDAPADASSSAR